MNCKANAGGIVINKHVVTFLFKGLLLVVGLFSGLALSNNVSYIQSEPFLLSNSYLYNEPFFHSESQANLLTEASPSACPIPKKLTFSSLRHPQIQSEIQPLLERVYAKLGIELEFVVTTSYRDLMLVANNQLMGSAAFAGDIISTMPGILAVQPPLRNMSYVLLCKKGVRCDETILNNTTNPKAIVVSTAMSKGVLKRYPQLNLRQMVLTNEVHKVTQFLKQGRVDYGIYPISDRHNGGLLELPQNLNYSILYDLKSFHVISRQISCLLPKIEVALREELNKLK